MFSKNVLVALNVLNVMMKDETFHTNVFTTCTTGNVDKTLFQRYCKNVFGNFGRTCRERFL